MKRQSDKSRTERTFQVGDWVFLKAQPYVQSSLAPRASQKLAFKFFSPYQILAKIGSVAYKLKLPPSSLVHPVFHVSQLKKVLGDHQDVTAELPDHKFSGAFQRRFCRRGLCLMVFTKLLRYW